MRLKLVVLSLVSSFVICCMANAAPVRKPGNGKGTIGGKDTVGLMCKDRYGRKYVWDRKDNAQKSAYIFCMRDVLPELDEDVARAPYAAPPWYTYFQE
ncbi:MAG: hypothetical protein A2583_14510 [Bdellovibrionales bacterium RIFOXYD1_FULL_53_11]|nr:MAG: hypothetical protein A2583_14510 [Bdellovibrionales bacterium RIFOXYD1_FULL_53_11]